MCYHDEYTDLDPLEMYECDEAWYNHPENYPSKDILDENFVPRDEQLKWFKNAVDDADRDDKIKFIAIIAHHALWSQGPHKIPEIFNKHVEPILKSSNKIIAWFCGHNHALEHYIWNRQLHATSDDVQNLDVMHQFLIDHKAKLKSKL